MGGFCVHGKMRRLVMPCLPFVCLLVVNNWPTYVFFFSHFVCLQEVWGAPSATAPNKVRDVLLVLFCPLQYST